MEERDGRTVVFTNDDAGSGDVSLFHELLDFLRQRHVRGTFFTVPYGRGQSLAERPEWVEALQRAREDGHEIGLHGYIHEGFEFGRPPDFMLDLMGPRAWQTLQNRRQGLHDQWRREVLQSKIEQGIAIFERVLGIRPVSWRSPCCAVCTELYLALAAAGIPYDSSLIVNPQGWPYAGKDFTTRLAWEPAHPPHPFRYHSGVTEVPAVSEYTWYLETDEHADKAWQLITDDFERVGVASGAFVAVSHYYAMTGPYRRGIDLYRRFFDHIEAQGVVHYRTVAEIGALLPQPWPGTGGVTID